MICGIIERGAPVALVIHEANLKKHMKHKVTSCLAVFYYLRVKCVPYAASELKHNGHVLIRS